jgi:ABC-type transport system substrate-binding protein
MVGRVLLRRGTRIGLFVMAAFLSAVHFGTANADSVMRVGMTASDIPTTGGIPNNGGEGFRFLGYPAYDALVNWDFKHTDQTADVTPGLATSWEVDEVDRTRWIFHLRKGVKFHDGSDFNADAVVFTLGRIYDDKSPQFCRSAMLINHSAVDKNSKIQVFKFSNLARDQNHVMGRCSVGSGPAKRVIQVRPASASAPSSSSPSLSTARNSRRS